VADLLFLFIDKKVCSRAILMLHLTATAGTCMRACDVQADTHMDGLAAAKGRDKIAAAWKCVTRTHDACAMLVA